MQLLSDSENRDFARFLDSFSGHSAPSPHPHPPSTSAMPPVQAHHGPYHPAAAPAPAAPPGPAVGASTRRSLNGHGGAASGAWDLGGWGTTGREGGWDRAAQQQGQGQGQGRAGTPLAQRPHGYGPPTTLAMPSAAASSSSAGVAGAQSAPQYGGNGYPAPPSSLSFGGAAVTPQPGSGYGSHPPLPHYHQLPPQQQQHPSLSPRSADAHKRARMAQHARDLEEWMARASTTTSSAGPSAPASAPASTSPVGRQPRVYEVQPPPPPPRGLAMLDDDEDDGDGDEDAAGEDDDDYDEPDAGAARASDDEDYEPHPKRSRSDAAPAGAAGGAGTAAGAGARGRGARGGRAARGRGRGRATTTTAARGKGAAAPPPSGSSGDPLLLMLEEAERRAASSAAPDANGASSVPASTSRDAPAAPEPSGSKRKPAAAAAAAPKKRRAAAVKAEYTPDASLDGESADLGLSSAELNPAPANTPAHVPLLPPRPRPRTTASSTSRARDSSTPSGVGGGGSPPLGANGKPALLTAEQKKANHIASEQKRRAAIRAGYDGLCEVVPALKAAVDEFEERVRKVALASGAASAQAQAIAQAASAGGPVPRRKGGRGRDGESTTGALMGGIHVGGEKIDGRAGPKSEAVVLSKTVEHLRLLLSTRADLLDRLGSAHALASSHGVSLAPPADQPYGSEWTEKWDDTMRDELLGAATGANGDAADVKDEEVGDAAWKVA
ncbi:hypothetical protein Rhopal_005728-T1 [Rhodotorula paludigena]|uniref:BHLH domain-containing protein n=1 Tax=Rhodotorula paludigena TaxID=86838 RepID=A0AAV5GVT3_9BASI|nr:hypothetical protein Rhopal_005728-T1 [Rhodotorula paludigena]